jgi:hypothetical protein
MSKKKPSRKGANGTANSKNKPVKAKKKPRAKASIAPAVIVNPDEPLPKTVPVLIRTKFYGNSTETQQRVMIPLVARDTIRLDMTIVLRKSEWVEIRPIRRDLSDIDGLIEDAGSLANDSQ